MPSHSARITLVAAASVVLAATLTPGTSRADDSTTVTVVGTSDVVDSNLVNAVLMPDFEKAYPQYTLKYVSQGTGQAINTAESGAASAVLVHAAPLEASFVRGGYSDEQYGRAIFWGDYVVLGPQSDPVGITTKAPHNVVKAYRLIAKAGTAGTANYVSRGGTPGTTVEEHAIWALTHGVTTCDVDAKTGGGGESPSTTTGSCPPSIDYPHWYHVTGDTQGPNVENADVCNYDGGNCYVLTDRGTYQYLAATNAISSLKIVASDNHGAAPGGSTLLVNSFHAYAVNPAEFANDSNVHINLAGAEAFLNWLTSPQGQADVGRFEADSGNPPFLPDAAPAITVHAPRHVNAGKRLTITGSVSNVVPGTPPLKAVEVDLDAAPKGAAPSALTTTATNAVGKFRLHYRPTRSRRYAVSTPQIAQIEQQVKDVGPFGDILQPSSQAIGRIPLQAKVTLAQPTERNGRVRISGELSPRVSGRHGRLIVMAASGRHALHKVASVRLAAGAKRFGTSVRLTPGRAWRIAVRYRNTGVISATKSITRTLVV